MLLGIIRDDFTGSSDAANTLAKEGLRVVECSSVPDGPAEPGVEAVRLSLRALDWLSDQGCRQILFEVCSTFDSTREGNIGPVADALSEALKKRRGVGTSVIVCPAFPAAGRSVYQGHLFSPTSSCRNGACATIRVSQPTSTPAGAASTGSRAKAGMA